MAGKVFFSVTMSLDGFIAPEERMDDPDVQRWMAQWRELQQWIFPQRFFRENRCGDIHCCSSIHCCPIRSSTDSGAMNPSSDIETAKNTFPAISPQLPSERSR